MHINPFITDTVNDKFVQSLRVWFDRYVHSFNDDDPEIRQNLDIKISHTYRVCDEILYLGQNLGLKAGALWLAEVIALLHDVGRFEQYSVYRTFKDSDSEDHATLGLQVIEKHELLKDLDRDTQEIVTKAIRHHNRIELPKEKNNTILFYEKLIRDADKLDIWRVVLNYYYRTDGSKNRAIELDFPDSPAISDTVIDDLKNERIVNMSNVKSLNDFKLLQMSWIYDINFEPTRKLIAERGYLLKLRRALPDSELLNKLYLQIEKKYLKL